VVPLPTSSPLCTDTSTVQENGEVGLETENVTFSAGEPLAVVAGDTETTSADGPADPVATSVVEVVEDGVVVGGVIVVWVADGVVDGVTPPIPRWEPSGGRVAGVVVAGTPPSGMVVDGTAVVVVAETVGFGRALVGFDAVVNRTPTRTRAATPKIIDRTVMSGSGRRWRDALARSASASMPTGICSACWCI